MAQQPLDGEARRGIRVEQAGQEVRELGARGEARRVRGPCGLDGAEEGVLVGAEEGEAVGGEGVEADAEAPHVGGLPVVGGLEGELWGEVVGGAAEGGEEGGRRRGGGEEQGGVWGRRRRGRRRVFESFNGRRGRRNR